MEKTQICITCGVEKSMDLFYRNTRSERRYRECKECRKAKYRERAAEKRARCRFCGDLLGYRQRVYHPECRILADREARSGDKWQCEPQTCRHYVACRTNVKLGARLPCQPESSKPLKVRNFEPPSEFDGFYFARRMHDTRH